MKKRERSKALFDRAKQVLVGGVDSPVRAFNAVGGDPIFFDKGQGAHLVSADGETYIDYVLSWGPHLLGHAHEKVTAAIIDAVHASTSFGAPNKREAELAELVCGFYPSCQKVRFVNSGTEATMSAIRLARGATDRRKIIKFNGCYHGHVDGLLVKTGSGALTLGIPDSKGVPKEMAELTLSLEYNDAAQLQEAFERHGTDIAGVIIEPVAGNMGVVPADKTFLQILRELCCRYGSILIFDEVMSGFRVHIGGAQALHDIKPDLTCFGKVIGGGMPCAAYGGSRSIMSHISPEGPVYQAGTLSGNPVAMAAGIAVLKELRDHPSLFQKAEALTHKLVEGLKALQEESIVPMQINHVGTMFTLFFSEFPIRSLKDALLCDVHRFGSIYRKLLDAGIYMAPSQYEANFMSCVHSDEDISKTIEAFKYALKDMP
jgi:glutamate-1-semialdehyde 2,1-aminomutase